MEQAGFTLIETFSVKRVRQTIQMIVHVVAKFMKERTEECAKRYDATVLGCTHPERNDRRSLAFCQFIQSMQFTPFCRGPHREHFYAKRGNSKADCHAPDQCSADPFGLISIFKLKCRSQMADKRAQRFCVRQREGMDLIALPVDSFLADRQLVEVRKDHVLDPWTNLAGEKR